VKGMSVRPHFRMIAHSAFIIVSRKLVVDVSSEQERFVVAEADADSVDGDEPLE